MTQRVPSAALLRPLIHQETIRPGHQENPRSFPNTSVPMLKPRPSCDEAVDNESEPTPGKQSKITHETNEEMPNLQLSNFHNPEQSLTKSKSIKLNGLHMAPGP